MNPEEAYQEALQNARRELIRLFREKALLEEKIATLTGVVEHLARLSHGKSGAGAKRPDLSGMGLTDAIRIVLQSANDRCLPLKEIRDELRLGGFRLEKYANEMAPIHNTVSRLKANGEVRETEFPYGKGYTWVEQV